MSKKLFDDVIAETLRELPRPLREKLATVAVVVAERPPRGEEEDLLGLFVGVPYGEKIGNPQPEADQIFLFRRNLEEMCESEEELAEEIRTTLLHEIGHYLGLDEDELIERGLE